MWFGGVRVVLLDSENRMLLVKQAHKERDVWMVPGGGIEEGESAAQAAVREVKEETDLDIEAGRLLWHIEEVSDRGQRFVNVFAGKLCTADAQGALGKDPEFGDDEQVLCDMKFMSREEIQQLDAVYPNVLKYEFWDLLDSGKLEYDAFRMREDI